MATLRASGQITFTVSYDSKTLTSFLSANHSTTQIYNHENKSYLPDYGASGQALVITPELYASGTTTSVINSLKSAPKWTINGSENIANFGGSVAKTAPYALTINRNLVSTAQLQITCEMIYVDVISKIETPAKTSITISKTENAGRTISGIAWTPKGNIFKQDIASLVAKAEMRRGSEIDNTNVLYRWQKMSPAGTYADVSNGAGASGQGTDTLTIKPSEVEGTAVYKCIMTDTDQRSGTYNTSVSAYVTFADITDPLQVSVYTTQGTDFRNGVGSKQVTMLVYHRGVLIQDPNGDKFNYTWSGFDGQGNKQPLFGTDGIMRGKTITIESPKHTGGAELNVSYSVESK